MGLDWMCNGTCCDFLQWLLTVKTQQFAVASQCRRYFHSFIHKKEEREDNRDGGESRNACAYFCILEIEELPMTILSHSNLCNLSNFPVKFRFVPMLNSGCFLGELIGNLRMFQLKPFYNSGLFSIVQQFKKVMLKLL